MTRDRSGAIAYSGGGRSPGGQEVTRRTESGPARPVFRAFCLALALCGACGAMPLCAREAAPDAEPPREARVPQEAIEAPEDPFDPEAPDGPEGPEGERLTTPGSPEEALERVYQPFPESPPRHVGDEPLDACDPDYSWDEWQEDSQEFLRGVSCHSFRWFDSLFGDEVDYPENAVNGLAIVGGSWNDYEGFDSRVRFRVRAPLPNWDNRWDLILGRGDEDAYISDTQTQDENFYNPGLINRNEQDSTILGLGGRHRGGREGWDWSAGVRLRTPVVPYVRVRWYWYKDFSPDTDLRFRQTFYWRSDDGFGVTARGDLAHAFRPQDVMRWESVLTHAEESPGTEWYVGQTWYHLMRDRRAFSVLAFATGETDGPVSMRDAGFNFIFRQPFTREWLWISYGPSLTWPRFEPEDEREATLGFNLWLEMEFGNWRY